MLAATTRPGKPARAPMTGSTLRGDHVFHLPMPRRTTDQPLRGLQRAAGEDRAVGGTMTQFQPFARPDQERLMLAHDVAAAHHREADAAGNALAGAPFAAMDRGIAERGAARAGGGLPQRQRG